ncbi:hypothetical protein [Ktedonospora formicarum]|uniref:Uncharacterized protein n=1 Tax=Ktedonospora formicarum TaxID=2778364 RepID=A0A8J3ICT3_9CHLR|nr:hypothetical protein [Ktedonospora formicarum]GHO50835.1 hypothetical protein KSX_89980 [Ktedonospora formicarum]
MEQNDTPKEPMDIWPPLYRRDLEAFLAQHEYSERHLFLLSWLIWLSLLSQEELFRVLSAHRQSSVAVISRHTLAQQIRAMTRLKLIDTIVLQEPEQGRYRRYYVTDWGLYLYSATVIPTPPLTLARLTKAYPVERDDLLARLSQPHIHLTLAELITRLIAEAEDHGDHLVSYQQPWSHMFHVGERRQRLRSDAALLIEHAGATYAFLVHVDTGPHHRAEKQIGADLRSLLDLRAMSLLYRQSWPHLLIVTTEHRLTLWASLLAESALKRTTRPLAGGLTTGEAMEHGLYAAIWRDLATLAHTNNPTHIPLIAFPALLREPASEALAESISQQHTFSSIRLKEAALPPPHAHEHLTRYVGESLQDEAARLDREQIQHFFVRQRKTQESVYGAGLLTLALTAQEKRLLAFVAHHPLLDLQTLHTLLRPDGVPKAIKSTQHDITHLFKQHLLDARLWPTTSMPPQEQERYLLTSAALHYMAVRQGEPLRYYVVHPKNRTSDEEQLWRQWGVAGLDRQKGHTSSLYRFMRQLLKGTHERGEMLYEWKNAQTSIRWYREMFLQGTGRARPDAELVFAPSPTAQRTTLLLEYDRGTTGTLEYQRKFNAYLDFQLITGKALPLILVVTPTQKSAQKIQQVLTQLGSALRVVVLLEQEVLAQGLTLAYKSLYST